MRVVFNACALLVNRADAGRRYAVAMMDVAEGGAEMFHVTEDDATRSTAIFRAHGDKTYSLCDASSFLVLERLGIRDAIDDHFRQYGRSNVLEWTIRRS